MPNANTAETAATIPTMTTKVVCAECDGTGVVCPSRWSGPSYACPEYTCHACHGEGEVDGEAPALEVLHDAPARLRLDPGLTQPNANPTQEPTMTTIINAEATARADRDHAAIQERLGIDTGRTFFPPGTEIHSKNLARRDRAAFLQLPTVGDGMEALREAVILEDRRDHRVDVGGISVDHRGLVCPVADIDGAALEGMVPTEAGWSRLASFAPGDVPSGLRTNVNAWASRRAGYPVVMRTRQQPAGSSAPRELWGVVSPSYVPYDLDAIAADVAEHMPTDARVRVRYDRQRVRIDVVLHNPHHFPGAGGTASVGEAHRLTLRVTSADDGTAGFRLRWSAERIRCVNLTLLKGKATVFSARHTSADLAAQIQAALAAQGEVAESFAATWRSAWTEHYLTQRLGGLPISGDEALRRICAHGLVRIPGLGKDGTWAAVKAAWEVEPGDTSAHVHNALTRAAHEAPTSWRSRWADDEAEEGAADLLYQQVRVLAEVPEEAKEKLGWWV